jgi:hypothetical protein
VRRAATVPKVGCEYCSTIFVSKCRCRSWRCWNLNFKVPGPTFSQPRGSFRHHFGALGIPWGRWGVLWLRQRFLTQEPTNATSFWRPLWHLKSQKYWTTLRVVYKINVEKTSVQSSPASHKCVNYIIQRQTRWCYCHLLPSPWPYCGPPNRF